MTVNCMRALAVLLAAGLGAGPAFGFGDGNTVSDACGASGCGVAKDCTGGSDCGCSRCGLLGGLLAGGEDNEPIHLLPEVAGVQIGGWLQTGYHNGSDGTFNTHPDRFNLHQAWLYAEKKAKGEAGGWDWGFRVDGVYGVDAPDTRSFGNTPGRWDYNPNNTHLYQWAVPQLYAELANDKWNIKAGHFYTPVGYEVVVPNGNFFYSHSMSQYWAEPFMHTGLLATYTMTEKLQLTGGWSLGWDTGFDQFEPNRGNNFVGGLAWQITDRVKFTYMMTAGNLGWRGEGTSHDFIFDVAVSEKLKYVLQADVVAVDGYYDSAGAFYPGAWNDNRGVTQYLLYSVNDCWSFGGRYEYFTANGEPINIATGGVNWKPHTNFTVRPEVKYQWGTGLPVNFGLADGETLFGVDAILTF